MTLLLNSEQTSSCKVLLSIGVLLALLSLQGCSITTNNHFPSNTTQTNKAASIEAINHVIDDFHDAADKGDKPRYLNHFASNGVFMGTDDWERWPLAELTDYVDSRFKENKGWSYQSVERHLDFSNDGNTAWFDEIIASVQWGEFRGTGVLIKQAEHWKIAHYSMSVLVPNEAFDDVHKTISEAKLARDKTVKSE